MSNKSDSIAYYIVRIMQRLALLGTGLHTIILWIVLINIVFMTTGAQQTVNHEFLNAEALQTTITRAVNVLSIQAGVFAGFAALFSLLMLLIPRVRRDEVRTVVDGVVIAVFCFVSVALSQFSLQYFIQRYLVGL